MEMVRWDHKSIDGIIGENGNHAQYAVDEPWDKNIVYSSKSNIKMTMVAGRIFNENGEYFIGEELLRIYEMIWNQ